MAELLAMPLDRFLKLSREERKAIPFKERVTWYGQEMVMGLRVHTIAEGPLREGTRYFSVDGVPVAWVDAKGAGFTSVRFDGEKPTLFDAIEAFHRGKIISAAEFETLRARFAEVWAQRDRELWAASVLADAPPTECMLAKAEGLARPTILRAMRK